jgi:hypothetical protein
MAEGASQIASIGYFKLDFGQGACRGADDEVEIGVG